MYLLHAFYSIKKRVLASQDIYTFVFDKSIKFKMYDAIKSIALFW